MGLNYCKGPSLATKNVITAADLKEEPLFISRQAQVPSQLSDWLEASLDQFRIVGTSQLTLQRFTDGRSCQVAPKH